MRSLSKYTIFSGKTLSEQPLNTIVLIFIHSVKITFLIITGSDHGVVEIQFCNRQDLEQRKISPIKHHLEKIL